MVATCWKATIKAYSNFQTIKWEKKLLIQLSCQFNGQFRIYSRQKNHTSRQRQMEMWNKDFADFQATFLIEQFISWKCLCCLCFVSSKFCFIVFLWSVSLFQSIYNRDVFYPTEIIYAHFFLALSLSDLFSCRIQNDRDNIHRRMECLLCFFIMSQIAIKLKSEMNNLKTDFAAQKLRK